MQWTNTDSEQTGTQDYVHSKFYLIVLIHTPPSF